jgi:hypothetical protein
MTIAERRPTDACLPPILLDPAVSDPEQIRAMARANGPYYMPARYLVRSSAASDASQTEEASAEVPAYLIGPTFRGDWAVQGAARVPGAEALLHHEGFVGAAAEMCGPGVEVVPEQVYVNLTAPSGGQPFSHVDIPEFVGVDRTNAPGWLLQAMGSSRLFEDARITIITAVAWFHRGERGFFRYWPEGREADSVRHEDVWNTAVVGDNDFMHHKVERTGPRDLAPPDGMTIDTLLDHDGTDWRIVEDGRTLARYDDEHIRLSLSWKAKVHAGDAPPALGLDEVVARFAAAMGAEFPARSVDELTDDFTRMVLSSKWNGYATD